MTKPSPVKTKVIAISQRVDFVRDRNEFRDAIDHRVINLVREIGALPIAIPNSLMESNDTGRLMLPDWLDYFQPTAVILSGGNNIGDMNERDSTEKYILNWAFDKQLPVLGICRGMQMMGTWAGAGLVEVLGHAGHKHGLIYENKFSGFPEVVNSFHNWALDKCPEDFEVIARSEDGSIEAIKHQFLPWIGCMWHPERESPFALSDIENLKELIRDR